MSLLQNSNAISAGGYNINNSLRFRQSATAFLNRTPASESNRQIWTWSGWVKRGRLGVEVNGLFAGRNSGAATYTLFYFSDTNTLNFLDNGGASLTTTQLFRDPSAWYHIVLAVDTTQATAANRVKMYVNGTQITAFTSATYPTLNAILNVNSTANHAIGDNPGAAQIFDGYMAEVNFVNAQQLTPSSFGFTDPITGQWLPNPYSGSYGTNGFYLKFSDIATTSGSNAGLGKDFSGNGNYWTTNNISVTAGVTYDAMIDSPTLTSETVANYATWNPVIPYIAGITLSNGNLNVAYSSGSGSVGVLGTIGISSGKWYWEYTFTAANPNFYLGWRTPDGVIYFGIGCSTGNILTETSSGSFSGSTVTVANGDVIGIAFDYAAGACYFYKNNTLFYTLTGFTTSSSTLFPIRSIWSSGGGASSGATTFGQRPFAYTPPSGYLRLNTYNLPDSTIKKGNKYMDATLYTGNTTTVTATNAGAFKPDLVWVKDRSAVASHVLTDSVRGTSAQLFSNLTNAEQTNATYVTSFNTNGFTVGVGNAGTGVVNNLGDTFVGWQWQAGQGTNTTNTSGSVTSTVSVNATAGFSIVTYAEPASGSYTFGHGLGVTPSMFIVRSRNAGADNWIVWHNYWQSVDSIPTTKGQYLNSTQASFTTGSNWLGSISSTTIGITVGQVTGGSANNVAYCWAEIAGFSKFGSYTGNGSADGPFVYLGFRPKFLMVRRTDSAESWYIYDTSTTTYNAMTQYLVPNTSAVEGTFTFGDYLSNGFKVRNTAAGLNASAGTFIYMAFAENPFKNSNAR